MRIELTEARVQVSSELTYSLIHATESWPDLDMPRP
jgi:hypothetical protein